MSVRPMKLFPSRLYGTIQVLEQLLKLGLPSEHLPGTWQGGRSSGKAALVRYFSPPESTRLFSEMHTGRYTFAMCYFGCERDNYGCWL